MLLLWNQTYENMDDNAANGDNTDDEKGSDWLKRWVEAQHNIF